jgi:tripartite-type tricarboxylate transporter receptor subunit TctC
MGTNPQFSPGRRRLLASGGGALAALAATGTGRAQGAAWAPSRPVRVVVGFVPGGTTDNTARLLAPHFSEWLGQPVVVDNRGGAGGNIGTEQVVRAAPDGHTLLLAQGGQIVINPLTYPSLGFDPLADLVPVAMARTGDFVLVAHPGLGVATLGELLALLRREPGRHHYATTAPGGLVHAITETFKARTGARMEGVHFRGSGQAVPEVLSGRVPLMIEGVANMLEHIRGGGVRPLMVASGARSPVLPEVPTAAEAGLPDFAFLNWFAFFAPRGTPQAIVDRYAGLTARALAVPAVAERIRATGDRPGTGAAEDLAAVVAREHRVFGEVVRAQGIRAE